MKILKTKLIASVELAETEISIDELEVLEIAVNLSLKNFSDSEIERLFGATRDELEGIYEDLQKTISACQEQTLEPAFA